MAAAKPPAKGGNVLTKKIGPLPGWAWAAIGVAGYLVYKQRKAAAAAAAAAAPATTATAAESPVAQAPSGYGYQGPGVGYGGSGAIPTGATAVTSGASSAVPNATAASGPSSQYTYISTPQEGAALQASGVPVFIGLGGQNGPVIPFQTGLSVPPGSVELYQTGSAGGQ